MACRDCKYFDVPEWNSKDWGFCFAPVPKCLLDIIEGPPITRPENGKDCQTFTGKNE